MDTEEENIGYQLAENFIFFQDIVKNPEEVFDCRSQEYKLANAWLNKLSMLGLETIDDMRLRNVYMSHLVACLNYGKLTAPFNSMPKPDGGLDKSDFQSLEKPRQAVCPRPKPGMTASQKACQLPQGGGKQCECDYLCCDKNDLKKDCSNVAPTATFDNICGYMMQYVNVPTCLDSQLRGTVEHSNYQTHDVFTNYADPAVATTSAAFYGPKVEEKEKCVGGAYVASTCATCGENLEFDHQLVRSQITTLLEAIASELRGEQTPGTNDYLEYELARYKNFKLQFPQVAEKISKLKAEQSLRSYFLLNLQNDLVKLLNDCCLQPQMNMRRKYNMQQ
ncbi:uncharacterized protein LOC105220762 [Zeugodacus cucurbitae]|uniref:Sec-independent protein translocase protein TatCy n=1 Tax=Zeugodacus cucurbitae TaxID=28588 RepID=A0A0A1X3Z8_ZEUCU|nr:uncharacterized protein LOC105220762 [Zeugodacus cucurbitae]